jgi:hypothetical protein
MLTPFHRRPQLIRSCGRVGRFHLLEHSSRLTSECVHHQFCLIDFKVHSISHLMDSGFQGESSCLLSLIRRSQRIGGVYIAYLFME